MTQPLREPIEIAHFGPLTLFAQAGDIRAGNTNGPGYIHDAEQKVDGQVMPLQAFYKWGIPWEPPHSHPGTKGGPGSGNFGHAGRPGLVGGSAPDEGKISGRVYATIGDGVAPENQGNMDRAWSWIPDWAKCNIQTVTLQAGDGESFTAGGQVFREGANWSPFAHAITIYGGASPRGEIGLKELMAHEVGHSLMDAMDVYASLEGLALENNHPDWRSRHDGAWHPYGLDVAKVFDNVDQARREAPFLVAMLEWKRATQAGQDGITDYSKAWAKDNNYDESWADMCGILLKNDGDGYELRALAKASGANDAARAAMHAMAEFKRRKVWGAAAEWKGGPGSGFRDHAGRPGQVGGSAPANAPGRTRIPHYKPADLELGLPPEAFFFEGMDADTEIELPLWDRVGADHARKLATAMHGRDFPGMDAMGDQGEKSAADLARVVQEHYANAGVLQDYLDHKVAWDYPIETSDEQRRIDLMASAQYLPGAGTAKPSGRHEKVPTVPTGEAQIVMDEVYAYTQERLKAAGVKTLRVWRGVADDQIAARGNAKVTTITGMPISSWSLSYNAAQSFAQAKNGVVLMMEVPVERIASTFLTGIGHPQYAEVVVLGGHRDKVTVYTDKRKLK